MREFLGSVEKEYLRYKGLAEATFEQLTDDELVQTAGVEGNSVITLVWHISGNLKSRFTDFLTTDGEKPWRERESEFDERTVNHAELRQKWEEGWSILFGALQELSDADLGRVITIRGQALPVHEALYRSLAHTSYHVGQIVFLGKSIRGEAWRNLSIPRGRPR